MWRCTAMPTWFGRSALAQRDVIAAQFGHSVPLLRDVMTAILVRFEWHGGCPRVRNGPPDTPSNPCRLTTDPCNKVIADYCVLGPSNSTLNSGPTMPRDYPE